MLTDVAPPGPPRPIFRAGRTRSSSAAASAAWRRPCGWARAAIGSPCSSSSTRPAAAPTCYRQDGFTFDAGPTIITAPFLFEELWALCGRRLARRRRRCGRSTPFYRIRFDDGARFDYSRRPGGDARGGRAASRRATSTGYERFMRDERGASSASASSSWATCPSARWTDMARIAPELIRLGSLRSRLRPGVALRPGRAAAGGVQLPSAAGRRQSVLAPPRSTA